MLSTNQVLKRLEAGEALRTGYTFNRKAWFANEDEVSSNIMRRLDKEGLILQDANGNITLSAQGRKACENIKHTRR